MTITLGDIIKRIMDVRNMNSSDLGRACGLSRNEACQIIADKKKYGYGFRLSTIHALARGLNVPQSLIVNAPYEIEEEE